MLIWQYVTNDIFLWYVIAVLADIYSGSQIWEIKWLF